MKVHNDPPRSSRMFAEVYPLKRLPRQQALYDYVVPQELLLQRGMGVVIPLRGQNVLGIVSSVKARTRIPMGRLKAVSARAPKIDIDPEVLTLFESIAYDLVQSPASLLHASIPLPPKRTEVTSLDVLEALPLTLPATEAPAYHALADTLSPPGTTACVLVPDIRRSAALIARLLTISPSSERTLVLAPTDHDAHLLASALHAYLPALLTGTSKSAWRTRVRHELQNQARTLLVGTRVAALLPVMFDHIYIVRSSHPSHEQAQRNPRFDARVVAHLRHAMRPNGRLVHLTSFPRVEDLVHVAQEELFSPSLLPPPIAVNMPKERPVSAHPLLSSTLILHMTAALEAQKRVFCVFNRRGGFKRVRCHVCAYTPLCPTCTRPQTSLDGTLTCIPCKESYAFPAVCPVCRKGTWKQAGHGNVSLVPLLQKILPEYSVGIWDADHPKDPGTSVVFVTEFVLEQLSPFALSSIGLVAHLDVDTPLFTPHMRASEDALLGMSEWRGVAYAARAEYLFQSESPTFFLRALGDIPHYLQEERSMREAYHKPPARRVLLAIDDTEGAKDRLQALATTIQEADPTAIIYLAPDTQNNQPCELEITLLPGHFKPLIPLFQSLPDSIRLSTHAHASYGTP